MYKIFHLGRQHLRTNLHVEYSKYDAMIYDTSLVPRPTCAFHFRAAIGPGTFRTCVTQKVEG